MDQVPIQIVLYSVLRDLDLADCVSTDPNNDCNNVFDVYTCKLNLSNVSVWFRVINSNNIKHLHSCFCTDTDI